MKRHGLIRIVLLFLFVATVSEMASATTNRFQLKKLVANLDSLGAAHTDPRLLNPWGLTFGRGGHLIVANNESDFLATAYNQKGKVRKGVISGEFHPTGLETNEEKDDFFIGTAPRRQAARLLFATEGGLILAYNHHVSSDAFIAVDRSEEGAIYKGLALADDPEDPSHQQIFAADFFNQNIDVFDHNFEFVTSFNDPTIPDDYGPFNIKNINGLLYVTYALRDEAGEDDVPGLGNGYVNVFNTDGTLVKRLISQGVLNAPWGLALAPDDFGPFAGALLVGNFGDGLIHAYNIDTGALLGTLKDKNGNDIEIEGLWALEFHPQHKHKSRLYFTAGPDDEENGLVGVIFKDHN